MRNAARILVAGLALVVSVPAAAQSIATVFVLDTTNSMSTIIGNLGATTTSFDTQLHAKGITATYGLLGYNSFFNPRLGALGGANTVYSVNGGFYGSAAQLAQTLGTVTTTRGQADAYEAIQYALSGAGYVGAAPPNAVRNLYLITDTFREAQYLPITPQGLESLLAQNRTALTVLVQSPLLAVDGTALAAVTRNASGQLVGFKANATCPQANFGKYAPAAAVPPAPQTILSAANQANINANFIQVALASGGVVADVDLVGQGPGLSCALASATLFTLQRNAAAVEQAGLEETGQAILRSQMLALSRSISDRVSEVVERVRAYREHQGGEHGAPDAARGLWAQFSNDWLSGTPANGRFDGTTQNYRLGADKLAFDDAIIGLAVSFDQTDYSLQSAGGRLSGTDVAITPYVALLLNDYLSWDAELLLAHGNDRISAAASGVNGVGTFDSWTYMASTNLVASASFENWTIKGFAGYAYGRWAASQYADSFGSSVRPAAQEVHLVRFGTELSLELTRKVETFLSLEYAWDLTDKPSPPVLPGSLQVGQALGMSGLTVGGGLRYLLYGKLLLTLEGAGEFLHRNEREYLIDGSVRVAF